MAQGPIESLVEAINDVVDDLHQKLEQAQTEFDERTNQHDSTVRKLDDLVLRSQNDIATTQEHITNVLTPQQEQLTEDIANLEQHIEDTTKEIE